jgi:hypothetical protein
MVVYSDFGLQTVFVTDPELIQQILLDDSDAFTKSPLYDNVLGRAGGSSSPKATTGVGKGASPGSISVMRTSSSTMSPMSWPVWRKSARSEA